MKFQKEIKVNSYVELREGFDDTDLYNSVESGATAWVRDKKTDIDGFKMIFVEWDKDNPKYAGELDKWVFESHFRSIADQGDFIEKYIQSVRKATDGALGSDGFFMITMVRRHDKKHNVDYYEPVVYSAQLDDEVTLMLEAQIAYMASSIFSAFVQDITIPIDEEEQDEPRR